MPRFLRRHIHCVVCLRPFRPKRREHICRTCIVKIAHSDDPEINALFEPKEMADEGA